jgi:hypothetical protein
MSASIRSLKNFLSPVDDASRNDLLVGDVVTLQALEASTTYAWTLLFVPEGSTATFSGSPTSISPGSFTVDMEGPYLVQLITDAGLSTESSQAVRLRALTETLGLKLVAAGERRDDTGIVPVDISTEGWANEQNYNLKTLEAAISSGGLVPYRTFLSGEALTAGQVVGFDTTSGGARVVAATNVLGTPAGRNNVNGILLDSATGVGESVRAVVLSGTFATVIFDVAPANTDQGAQVFLGEAGEVSLVPPTAPETFILSVGTLFDADAQEIQFLPQIIGYNP